MEYELYNSKETPPGMVRRGLFFIPKDEIEAAQLAANQCNKLRRGNAVPWMSIVKIKRDALANYAYRGEFVLLTKMTKRQDMMLDCIANNVKLCAHGAPKQIAKTGALLDLYNLSKYGDQALEKCFESLRSDPTMTVSQYLHQKKRGNVSSRARAFLED